ncbi:MAG TPA: hypothetical protein O0W90_03055 [Methanocorpusculum sp.]|nr:hypothetical protein [Methanocorpusculum sp.]
MKKSADKKILILSVILIIAAVTSAAGCIEALNPTPNEANIRGHIISLDTDYLSDEFIWKLILWPNSYDKYMINAVDEYLPKDKPVIELGAGIGVLSAYINDRISIPVDHIAVEPNPYLYNGLMKTKEINSLGTTFVQKAIAYGSENVTMSVKKDITDNKIVINGEIVNTVSVPASSVQKIAETYGFKDKKDITVVMSVVGTEHEIIQREIGFFEDSVGTVISAVYTDSKNNPETFCRTMNLIGFKQCSSRYDEENNYQIMVFVKDPSIKTNPALRNNLTA